MTMHYHPCFKSAILLAILTGCCVGPKYAPPAVDLPSQWIQTAAQESGEELRDFIWWQALNDPMLNSLIERASIQNLDLSIACLRISEARQLYTGKKGDRLPHIDASLTYSRAYYNQHTLDDILGIDDCGRHRGNKHIDIFEIGFDADWEIDLFGKTTHELAALLADAEAMQEMFHDAWVLLSAEIGKNYIEFRGIQRQLYLLLEQIHILQQKVALTDALLETGLTSQVEINRAEEQLEKLEGKKPSLEMAANRAIYRLSILLGQPPAALIDELSTSFCTLPELPQNPPFGIPSEVLRRRPDIRKAERELASATERVGSAIANLFPRFSLKGFIGDITPHFSSLFGSTSHAWFIGPQLLQPIFNSRLIQQDIQLNKIRREQACLNYKKTILAALEEAENAIGSFHSETIKNRQMKKALQNSSDNYALVNDLYHNGFKDYFELLSVRQELISNREMTLQSDIDLLLHYIALYKSLGGSWEIDPCENIENIQCENE